MNVDTFKWVIFVVDLHTFYCSKVTLYFQELTLETICIFVLFCFISFWMTSLMAKLYSVKRENWFFETTKNNLKPNVMRQLLIQSGWSNQVRCLFPELILLSLWTCACHSTYHTHLQLSVYLPPTTTPPD